MKANSLKLLHLTALTHIDELLHYHERADMTTEVNASPVDGETAALRAQFFTGVKNYIPLRLASIVLAYVTQVLLARWVGDKDFGIFSLAMTVSITLGYLVSLGFPTGMERFLPLYLASGDLPHIRGLVRLSQGYTLLASSMVILVTMALVIGGGANTVHQIAFAMAMVMVPLFGVGENLGAYFQGHKRWLATFIPDNILTPLLFLGLVCWGQMTFSKLVSRELIGAMAIAMAISVLVQIVLFYRGLSTEYLETTPQYERGKWLGTSLPVLFLTFLVILMNRADLLVVGYFWGAHVAGVYAAALATAELLNIFYKASNAVSLPSMAPLFAKGRLDLLQSLTTLSIRAAFVPTMIFAIPLALLGPYIVGMFGQAFEGGVPSMLVLIALQVLASLTGAPGFLLIMSGRQNLIIKTMAAIMTLHVVLLFVLTPWIGMIGAAIASLISSLASKVVVNRMASKVTGVNVSVMGGKLTAPQPAPA